MTAMNYSITDCFMTAYFTGLAFALLYEVLRLLRLLVPVRAVTFVCDILFFLAAAEVVTLLSLTLGNYIRGFTVLGFGAGVFTYLTTVGRILNRLENAVVGAMRVALSALFGGIAKVFRRCFGAIAHRLSGLFGRIHNFSVNTRKKLCKPLKKRVKMVYNKESRTDDNGGSESGHVIKAKVRRSTNA